MKKLCPKKLDEMMWKRRITATELARQVGVSRQAISYLLAEPSDPRMTTAIAVAKALGVSIDQLLTDDQGE